MHKTRDARLDAIFAALANPTRRAIVARLSSGEASVTDLTQPFGMSQPAVSKHLRVLERAGLVTRARQAQWRLCRLEAGPLAEGIRWLERYRRASEERSRRVGDSPAEPIARNESRGGSR
jgi:DNA-binding transcriptional ArsR family regulator